MWKSFRTAAIAACLSPGLCLALPSAALGQSAAEMAEYKMVDEAEIADFQLEEWPADWDTPDLEPVDPADAEPEFVGGEVTSIDEAIEPITPEDPAALEDWLEEYGSWEVERDAWEGNVQQWGLAAAVHVPIYRLVAVSGTGTDRFYYIRQDHFRRQPGRTNAERAQAMAASGAFGPHPMADTYQAKPGYNYYFIPECGNAVNWDKSAFHRVPYQGSLAVKLDCTP